MLHRIGIQLTSIALVLCCATSHTIAQWTERPDPILVNGSNNEDSKAALALLAQTIKENEIVILIARLGKGESARRLNRRRLRVVHSYLDVTRASPIPERNIVMAEGDPVRSRGRIEVYLRGKLFMVFILERNKNFAPET